MAEGFEPSEFAREFQQLAFLDELGRRRQALNVYRGQALSFAFTPHGRFRLDFLRMTAIDRSQVILPDADLLAIEDHTIGISALPRR